MSKWSGREWQVPPGWPQPPEGWTPSHGWRPSPDWPPAPSGWRWWRRTRAGWVRLGALIGVGVLVLGGCGLAAVQMGAAVLSTSSDGPTITIVNDTQAMWEAVACTGDYYPAQVLPPTQQWRPDSWPFQDDDGAGCFFAKVDKIGHLGEGVCLYVPQNGKQVFRLRDAHPMTLSDCMARSNPS